jgi:Relaxase/Mobilisation nuclease domain
LTEERFCKALGFAEHQRISVVHHDTDNVHIYVAINKIHPTTFTIHIEVLVEGNGRISTDLSLYHEAERLRREEDKPVRGGRLQEWLENARRESEQKQRLAAEQREREEKERLEAEQGEPWKAEQFVGVSVGYRRL